MELVSPDLNGSPALRMSEITLHHEFVCTPYVATNKGAWGEIFGRIFARAGMSLDDASNLVRLPTHSGGLPGHLGRHPEVYHRWVHARLTRATLELESADDYSRALRGDLDAIRLELQRRPWYVSGMGVRP